MDKSIYVLIVAVALAIPLSAEAATPSRCPSNDMGCNSENFEKKVADRIDQGRKEVNETNRPVEKAKAVGKTLSDCASCATRVIVDSIKGSTIEK